MAPSSHRASGARRPPQAANGVRQNVEDYRRSFYEPGLESVHLTSPDIPFNREFTRTAHPREGRAGLGTTAWLRVQSWPTSPGGHQDAILHLGKPRSRMLRNLPEVASVTSAGARTQAAVVGLECGSLALQLPRRARGRLKETPGHSKK